MRQLAGSRAIITGASSGIGRAIAVELNRHGVHLMLAARRQERLAEICLALNNNATICSFRCGDITDSAFRKTLVAAAVADLGGLDILVNNAGIGGIGAFLDANSSRLQRIFEVNVFAPLELIRLAAPVMAEGRMPLVVNVGSVLGHVAVPGKTEYCASKFALRGFSEAVRVELKQQQIDLLLVSPSTTQSEFFDQTLPTDCKAHQPLSRPAANPPQTLHKLAEKFGIREMSAEAVARATRRAMQRGQPEIILSVGGKLVVDLQRLAPGLYRWLIHRFLG